MGKIDISSLEITDFEESDGGWHYWLSFSVEEVKYQMFLLKGKEKNEYQILCVVHLEGVCPFCQHVRSETPQCKALNNYKLELFYRVVKGSKNRLRWLTRITN